MARKGLVTSTDQLITALQWFNESVQGEAGPEFADAIEWCLISQIGRRMSSDGKWKEELFEKVVEPLRCCYKHLTGDQV